MSRRIPPDAFDYYLSLGLDRSYQAVADRYDVSKRSVTKHATKEGWQDRIARVESKAREVSEQKSVETPEGMNARHLKCLRAIQGKALEALKSVSLKSGMDAVRALDIAIKQERTIRGEPTDRTVISIEETIKSEYERWMTSGKDGQGARYNDNDEVVRKSG